MILTKTNFSYAICLTILLAGCTLTTTKKKDPVFDDVKKVVTELTSLVASENINLNGKEVAKNDKTTTELEVDVTNGKNIPTNDDERKALGKSIATTVKRNLKDKNEFETYTVLFVTTVETGGVTKRNWVGDVFMSSEL